MQISLFGKDEKGNKEYKVILKDVTEKYLTVENQGQEMEIERKNISQVKWGNL